MRSPYDHSLPGYRCPWCMKNQPGYAEETGHIQECLWDARVLGAMIAISRVMLWVEMELRFQDFYMYVSRSDLLGIEVENGRFRLAWP